MKKIAVVCTSLAALMWSHQALALSCVPCGPITSPRVAFGQPEISNLPRNFALIMTSAYQEGEIPTPTLTGPGSPSLDCQPLSEVERDHILCRGTGMTSTASYALTFDDDQGIEHTLTISDTVDDTAPEPPTIVAITERDRGGNDQIGTGPTTGIDIVVAVAESPAELTLEVGITVDGAAERIWAVTGFEGEANQLNAFIGGTFCQCDGYADGKALLSNETVRVRTVDRAGNRSAWTGEVIPEPDPEGCGCSATGESSNGLGALALLGLLGALALRRTRNRSR